MGTTLRKRKRRARRRKRRKEQMLREMWQIDQDERQATEYRARLIHSYDNY